MADPLSLIALGAGIGGLAGKFAEKAWDASERWLTAKFGQDSEIAKKQAYENATAFMCDLVKKIQKLEESGRINGQGFEKEQQHPQFSATLHSALIRAAQTDDQEKHILLAELIANRLATESESIIALASQIAVDAISLTTKRQLKMLALCSFIEDVRPQEPLSDHTYLLDLVLKKFVEYQFYDIDAMHLVALSCISYDPTSEKDLNALLGMKFKNFEDAAFTESKYLELLQINWDSGLSGVQLTSVGSLIGALAFDRIVGSHIGSPKWYGT